jgi:heme/copper-type cytochrome/quinol oxidase subunit 4
MEKNSEQDDFKRDILIYFSIIALVGVIIFISHLQLKALGIFLIVPIACVEAGILGYYFMHLMTRKKTVHLVLLLTVVVFLSLLFWPAWDIAYSPRTPSEFTVY